MRKKRKTGSMRPAARAPAPQSRVSDIGTPSAQTLWLLTALQLRGIGPTTVRKLADVLSKHPDTRIQDALPEDIARDEPAARTKAFGILEKCASWSVRIFSILDPEYPACLRQIKDAPPIIYAKGSISALGKLGCAVVGTRNASDAGLRIANRIAGLLARHHLMTISGLALGIDTAAHSGALEHNGITVAVLAHGLDTVAPASNRKLADQILANDGALISEHEPGVPPRPPEFVRRNRIQSGLALCSIIVESGKLGGAIHQARFTREQGRALFAVLPEFNGTGRDFNSEGGKFLVESLHAIPLRNSTDLEKYLDNLVRSAAQDSHSALDAQLHFQL